MFASPNETMERITVCPSRSKPPRFASLLSVVDSVMGTPDLEPVQPAIPAARGVRLD